MDSVHACPFFRLLRSDYGNGDYIEYTYDKLDRVKNKSYNGSDTGHWRYNSNGQVGYFNVVAIDESTNTIEYSVTHYFDGSNKPERLTEKILNVKNALSND